MSVPDGPRDEDPLAWIERQLRQLQSRQLLRDLRLRDSRQLAVDVVINDQRLVNFSSNDYLGLAGDERLAAAVSETVLRRGWGSGASPLVSGRAALHAQLEQQLAEFEGSEAALLFPSGYAANVGAIAALAGRGDHVYSDAKNHASIIDGCRLSGAQVHVYPHGDVAALERQMAADEGAAGRRLIVTDSLFSMDGDLAPLAELAELASRRGAMLMVDEAHATGVLGERGRGAAELLGVEDQLHVRVGTLSKALGSVGGFVAGSQLLIRWLANRARTQFFSTAMPEAAAAASVAALEIVQREPHRRSQLLGRATQLRDQLRRQGWSIPQGISQLIPVLVGRPERALQLSAQLQQRGLLAPAIRPPSVPPGESLLRISLCYGHQEQHLQQLADALGELRAG